jgi:rhodanese-related sulfurtransferase
VLLYCEHGPRSGIASFLLFLSGYENVYSLEGHMKGWRGNMFPVETGRSVQTVPDFRSSGTASAVR